MPVEFRFWRDELPEQAETYLRQACERNQLAVITLEETLASVKCGKASIYLIFNDNKLIGALTLCLRQDKSDLYLELPLMGGMNLRSWRDDLVKFLFETAKSNKCTRFTMIGRKGFEKLFPEMKLLCCVYGRNLTEDI